MHLCLCLPLFVVLGPFCAVFNFAHLELDIWTDESFNDISTDERDLYMYDNIHPTKAGYRDWWGPELERQLLAFLAGEEG